MDITIAIPHAFYIQHYEDERYYSDNLRVTSIIEMEFKQIFYS